MPCALLQGLAMAWRAAYKIITGRFLGGMGLHFPLAHGLVSWKMIIFAA